MNPYTLIRGSTIRGNKRRKEQMISMALIQDLRSKVDTCTITTEDTPRNVIVDGVALDLTEFPHDTLEL